MKKTCLVVFCAEILQQFSQTFAKRLLTSCVFLPHGETLHCENKIDKSFDSIEIFIRVDLKRHRNFSDYFCCIYIFSP